MSVRHKAPIFELEPHKTRILQAILYLIAEAGKKKLPITQYMIVKALFLADKRHLNSYGRPVTFDNYFAMTHGPVPTFAYNLLCDKIDMKKEFGLKSAPWTKSKSEQHAKAFEFSKPMKSELDELSESDLDALDSGLTVVSSLTFSQLRKLTHEDPAYVDAWEDEGPKKAYPMSYGLLFEAPDYDQAEDLEHASKFA